ncbi:MAG: hypothetical protein LBT09_10790 [Planctomycetaceae bacterium]|jgi:glycerophosphoryl diester phosphodiesterase|nr:hypothetical protein [Planctomycetaceae bacterium]
MKTSVIYLVVFFVTLICFAGMLMAEEAMPVLKLVNIAHRGASYLAPENTVIAYKIAVSAGASGAECDVRQTADNVLILSHDGSTKRTMGGKNLNIAKLKFEELRQLDAGNWKGKQFKNEKVPSFDEYLETLKGTKCAPVVEIKIERIELPVIEAIRRHDMISVTAVIAFSEQVVKEVRRLEPNICVAWLYGEDLRDKGSAEDNADRLAEFLLKKSRELGTNVFNLNHLMLSEKLVMKLRKSGIHVWCWTVNDTERMKILLDWGVDGITTDRPELLDEILKKRKPK